MGRVPMLANEDEINEAYLWTKRLDIMRLAFALAKLPRHTLWCVGDMEEGPFARLCWPMSDGGYTGGYFEATGDTPERALLAAIAKASAQ